MFSPVTLPAAPQAGVIDFESIPGLGAPVDRLEISNQFDASDGIVFRLEDGSFPELALVGLPETAFAGPPNNAGSDNPNIMRTFWSSPNAIAPAAAPESRPLNSTKQSTICVT